MTVFDGRVRLGDASNSRGAVRTRSALLGPLHRVGRHDVERARLRRGQGQAVEHAELLEEVAVASEKAKNVRAPRVIVIELFGVKPVT